MSKKSLSKKSLMKKWSKPNPAKKRRKTSTSFDLTNELHALAIRLMADGDGARPANKAEAFKVIQDEVARLVFDHAVTNGIKLAESRLSTYAVDTKQQRKLVNDLRKMLNEMVVWRVSLW